MNLGRVFLSGRDGGNSPTDQKLSISSTILFSLQLNHFSPPIDAADYEEMIVLNFLLVCLLFYNNLNKKLNESYDI